MTTQSFKYCNVKCTSLDYMLNEMFMYGFINLCRYIMKMYYYIMRFCADKSLNDDHCYFFYSDS